MKLRELKAAIIKNNYAEVKAILEAAKNEAPALINTPDVSFGQDKYRSIDTAAEIGTPEIIKLLCEYGADLKNINPATNTYPIHLLVERKPRNEAECEQILAILDIFKQYNATFECKAEFTKWNPIHLAIAKRNFYLIEKLTECGCDINSQDRDAKTPFQHAFNQFGANQTPLLALIINLGGKIATDATMTFISRYSSQKQNKKLSDIMEYARLLKEQNKDNSFTIDRKHSRDESVSIQPEANQPSKKMKIDPETYGRENEIVINAQAESLYKTMANANKTLFNILKKKINNNDQCKAILQKLSEKCDTKNKIKIVDQNFFDSKIAELKELSYTFSAEQQVPSQSAAM